MAKKNVPGPVEKSKGIMLTANEKALAENVKMMTLNASIFRRDLLARLLNPGLDINYECRYPDEITMRDYTNMWDREGIGSRVVKILPDECWAMEPNIYETEDADETEFEKVLKELIRDRHIFHYLHRIDVMSGIGSYGLLLCGLSDGKDLDKPVEGIDEVTGEVKSLKNYELSYLRPFDQNAVSIKLKERNVSSPRYSHPVMYEIEFEGDVGSTSNVKKRVHWTRVLHVADNKWGSEVFGTPRMKDVFNRLLDIRKIVSGSGEMFWKGAFPGYAFSTKEGMEDVEMDTDAMREEFKSYFDGLQRYMTLTGVDVKDLQPQATDPTPHFKVQVMFIALSLGIPYRKLMGSEQAQLASTSDTETWNKRIAKRQNGYVTPMIIRPFIDRMMAYGVLPEAEEYFVDWPDLSTPSDKDKSEVAKNKTDAMAKYIGGSVDSLMPPKEYLMEVLGMEETQAEAIVEAAEEWVTEHPPEPEPVPTEEEENGQQQSQR